MACGWATVVALNLNLRELLLIALRATDVAEFEQALTG
jgi:hypothetical protein